MLQVAIHGDDDVALGFMKTGGKGGGLSEIPTQPDHLQMPVGLHQVGQQFEAAVGRGVVNEEDFVGLPERLENGGEPVVQAQDGGLLVVYRNDDR